MAERGLRRWGWLLLALAAGGWSAAPARADGYIPLVRVTCAPPAGYAAIETIGLPDAAPDEGAALAAQGFRDLGEVAREPLRCALPEGTLVIEVTLHERSPTSGCAATEDGRVEVSLSGRTIVSADSLHGGCADLSQHSILVSGNGIRHCVISLHGGASAVNCSSVGSH
jgi:hypothetical protein